jgi:hypothetical protein
MFTKKTRVIIATILLIAALALALRGRIMWEEITQWITAQSLPLITSQSEPLEQPKQLSEQLSSSPVHDTSEVSAPSSAIAPSDEIQVIPTPEKITEIFEQTKNDIKKIEQKKPRIARRRRKKESVSIPAPVSAPTELLRAAPVIIVTEEKQSEPSVPQPAPAAIIAEPLRTASVSDATPVYAAPQLRQATKKTIRICNKIDAQKLGVKHWTGTYSPTKLEITLNNVPFIIVGSNPTTLETLQEIPCTDNRITVSYHYEFLNGMRKGSDTVIYTFTDATQLEMHFSWDTPWHVELSAFGEPLRRDTTP